MRQVLREITENGGTPVTARDPGEIASYFKGWELVEPGVVPCSRWRPDGNDLPFEVYLFGEGGRIN